MRAHVSLAVASAALLAVSAGSAFAGADTLTGQYGGLNELQIGVNVNGSINSINMFTFNWDRTDLPAGPGVDTTIPDLFLGYCIELTQGVSGGTPHTYLVLDPAAAGLDATDILRLSRLWGSFANLVDSPVKAAAFQMSIYELILDTNVNLSADNFIVQNLMNNPNQTAAKALAESWLAAVIDPNYAGPVDTLAVLRSETVQDQIVRVPAPGAAALGLVGTGLLAARRRRA